MCCASLLEIVRENSARLLRALRRIGVFSLGTSADRHIPEFNPISGQDLAEKQCELLSDESEESARYLRLDCTVRAGGG